MRPLVSIITLLIAATLIGCGGSDDVSVATPADSSPTGTVEPASNGGTGSPIMIGDAPALLWGDGPAGVVLVHGTAFDAASWEDQAVLIAAQGSTVIAVEDASNGSIAAAVDHLRSDLAIDRVTLIGGSSGADSILAVEPYLTPLPDALILLSPNRVVEGLGSEPKLFVASEEEVVADVAIELAETSPGDDNTTLILPGRAHAQGLFTSDQADVVMTAILDHLANAG